MVDGSPSSDPRGRPEPFGTLADGRVVRAVRLAWPGGIAVEVLEYGAIIRSLTVPVGAGVVETILGFPDLAGYEADRSYQGCVVGRVANRIGGAAFSIDGQRYEVTANEGQNCLHGGVLGLSKRLWRFAEIAEDGRIAVLTYDSPDGEEGFPGRVLFRTTVALTADDTLTLVWEAATDRSTPINLTHHLYFNLSGDPGRNVLDHRLAVASDHITPVWPDLIPTGELKRVEETVFDLRDPKRIGDVIEHRDPQLMIGQGIDHNWALDLAELPAVRLTSPESGLALHLTTDQPGVQIYSGQGLSAPFVPHGGLAIEPQGFPDAINRPDFPSVLLKPGETYRRWVSYRFERP